MDWLLIGSLGASIVGWFYTWGTVIIGLGMVIFIHELGHFLVAKACGVKCEKFYVGFDVPISIPLGKLGTIRFPRTLWKKQWGETEYGIGILPLGGYVKMLGQDDNPYKQEAEFERARGGDAAIESEASAGTPSSAASAVTATGTTAPPAGSRWDPRSYLAKSVPQRMAIISAGVIMNVILAFVLSSIAYAIGVPYIQPVVGHVMPGGSAWQHDWPVGARITSIAGVENPRWDKEIVKYARLAEKGERVEITYIDPHTGKSVTDTIEPQFGADNLSRLGISSSYTMELLPVTDGVTVFAIPGTAAAEAGFQGRDIILSVKAPGEDKPVPVKTYAELQSQLVKHPGEKLEVTVDRLADQKLASSSGKLEHAERHATTVSLAPDPIRDLGLVLKFGPIIAVQPHSPAAEAGLQAGDEIIRVTDGAEVLSADPLFMPELLRRRAGKTVKVLVMREGKQIPIDVKLREVDWSEEPTGASDSDGNMTDEPMSAPALGIAYDLLNEIDSVSGPAAAAGLKKGQKLTKIKFWVRGPRKSANEEGQPKEITLPLGADKRHWPAIFFAYLQRLAPDTTVELYPSSAITLGSMTITPAEGENKPIAVTPVKRSDWFRAERGLRLEPLMDVRVAKSFGDALQLGAQETGDAMSMVVTFLRRIRQLGSKAAGPLGILQIAAGSLEMGFTTFLLILAMLSANLAVVNILPIPVLDGGHLMFLAYEGIRRKPPSEKVMIGLNFLGLALILTVMVLVFSLDIGRWFRG